MLLLLLLKSDYSNWFKNNKNDIVYFISSYSFSDNPVFIQIRVSYLYYFPSVWKLLTFLADQVCWWWIPSFLFVREISISLKFLEDNFTGYRILGWWCVFFQHLKYFMPPSFLCVVSDEKSAVILTLVLLLLRYLPPPLASSGFSLSLFLQFEYGIQKGFICFVCILYLWAPWSCDVLVFVISFWKF